MTLASSSDGGPLRVAVVGAGMISVKHLTAWKRTSDARVVAVVDPDEDRAVARAQEFAVPLHYPSLDALLARERIDAIDIASSRESHASLLQTAIERRIPAICEKPLVPDAREAAELATLARGRVRIMVNQNFRFRPYYEQMKAWIEEGLLGRLTGVTISCRSSGLLPDASGKYPYIERQPYVRNEARLMIAEVLIHRLDVARWLCGPLHLIAACLGRSCDAVVGETEATLLFETLDNHVAVVVDGNFGCAGYPALSVDRVEIIGTRARIDMDHDVLRLHAPSPLELRYGDPAAAIQKSFDLTMQHFVDCVRSGTAFRNDIEDNVETLRLVDEAYRAAAPWESDLQVRPKSGNDERRCVRAKRDPLVGGQP